ncbi:MAG TPA: ATP-binding protein [Terracidiphilus sp.]|nr:ATP-binding protein [Terracidiphilus sp.]
MGLVLLEALSIGLFAFFLTRLQSRDMQDRVRQRLEHQVTSLSVAAEEAYEDKSPDFLAVSVRVLGGAPSVLRAKITDTAGNMLYVSAGQPSQIRLNPDELSVLSHFTGHAPRILSLDAGRSEAVKPIYYGFDLRGFAWVESDPVWDDAQVFDTLRATLVFGTIWIIASFALVWLMSLVITRPLAILHHGTRALAAHPESSAAFPLPVVVQNEFGDLIAAFNGMVASIEEQRAGLRDTLSLLDSLLANAPIGFAFFDRASRFVRVSQVFASLTGISIGSHLGRTPDELLRSDVALQFDEALQRVFSSQVPVTDLEFHGVDPDTQVPWNWLVSAYPVRTMPEQVRWVGVIVRDVTERVRAEEALRRSEKLAATGRLAASIAHEINNPLEGLTNLLFLLRTYCDLKPPALEYATMAEHEARRIAEIAQKTLRFYRQSTLPTRVRPAELIDSILDLFRTRLHTLNITIVRDLDPNLTLFCFEGEIRQVLVNLIGNAIDATSGGGRIIVRLRASQRWRNALEHWGEESGSPPNQDSSKTPPDSGNGAKNAARHGDEPGIRITIADTGVGMTPDVRAHIYEPFFTTKDATGTGLGLWVSQEIVAKHRGELRVRSRAAADGKFSGTVFQLYLPDDESLAARSATSADQVELQNS